MVSFFNEFAVMHDQDVISIFDCAKSMGNHDGCDISELFTNVVYCLLHDLFVFLVKCTCSLVQQQDLWFLDKCSGDCDSLLLSSRKLATRASDLSVDSMFTHLFLNEV